MPPVELKPKIEAALKAFSALPLADASMALFESLGYSSKKRLKLSPNNREQFLATFAQGKTINERHALSGEWRSIDFLFQLTDEELGTESKGAYNGSVIESYLFFAIELKGDTYTRSDLAGITRELNKLFAMPVLVLFRHGETLTLAVINRRLHKRDTAKDVLEKVTLIKDIRTANPHRAHVEVLFSISHETLREKHNFTNFVQFHSAWQKSLDTSALNSEFYSELAGWYYWATSTIRLPIVPAHLSHCQDPKEENVKQFTIRLLCRTIFCWFIKERGLIPPHLLEITDATGQPVILTHDGKSAHGFATSNSYYRGILQNIFFNCLNTPMDQRRLSAALAANDKTVKDPRLKKFAYRGKNYLPEDFDYSLFDRIPYLNGGLFDCLLEDNASDTIDDGTISIPNKLFYAVNVKLNLEKKTLEVSGLNRILERYKFTITENTPLEEEIALDPELLGLVFENLLAEVDVSDQGASKSARRYSGSYYTPRRIIDYMVNESLRLHLEGYCRERDASGEELSALTGLIHRGDFDSTKHNRLAGWVVDALDAVRILDPACGSGAFPMGALHRMVDILRCVDAGNKRWLHRQVGGIPDTRLRQKAELELKHHADDYSRKLGLIKNAIYGVDIQPLAVLLTKLRLFISLLVDQKLNLDDATHNYGLSPLPNLETKVLCANTLRELQVSLFEQEAIRHYQAARDEYYQPDITAARRDELTNEIAAALAELLPSFAKDVTGQVIKDRATQALRNRELLREWFRHSSLPAPFFNFSVFFPEVCPEPTIATLRGEFAFVNEAQRQQDLVAPIIRSAPQRVGFDIVIGNPPYGGTKLPDDVREALVLKSKDPYGAFIARFLADGQRPTPLKPDGILSYIVSDTFMTIKSHYPLREQLMGNRVHKLIRVHPDTFRAVVNTAIIVVQKGGGPGTVAPADDALARLWEGPAHGPWCRMVDLTQVSIHQQHDRFLTLLFDTAGTARRRSISTESCAAYHYPQALIATNSNLPFFVASPKLFELMNDTTAQVKIQKLGDKRLPVRTVQTNGLAVHLAKLGDIAVVKHGLTTGGTHSVIYRDAHENGSYPIVDKDMVLSENEMGQLTEDEKENGFEPKRFNGKRFVRYDNGGLSDARAGWLPRYLVPSGYYIDWSRASVDRMKTLEGFRHDGREFYFQKGITFSHTGVYSPTFRFSSGGIFHTAGSCLFSSFATPEVMMGILNSRLLLVIFKSFINHTVNTSEDPLKELPILLKYPSRLLDLVKSIANNQRKNIRYDYASHEQLEIDRLVYEAYGLSSADIAEVETWFARRYDTLAAAQRQNLRRAGKVPAFDRWNVYCDETGHLSCDRAPEMILGAMLVPHDRVRSLTLKLRERLAALGWPRTKTGGWAELKWTKVSPSGLKFYQAALDFFIAEPDLRFRALIAPKGPPPPKLPRPPAGSGEAGSPAWEEYHALLEETAPAVVDHQQRHDAWYYDRYFDLLRDTLLPPAHHHIFVDVKDTRGGARLKALESRLSDAHYDWTRSGIVESVQQIHSDEVLLDQLVDVLLGCVAWTHATPQRNVGHTPSPAKAALARKFQAALAKLNGDLVPKVVIDHSSERSPAR
ncbi:MAG: hypothetical protein NTW21_25195 [Verrucomicrobia bacterium]|nr:hypothetical protein [Verrucomicrobiota bacterium]